MLSGFSHLRRRQALLCAVLSLATVLGCNGSATRTPSKEQAKVTGSLMKDGKPLKVDTKIVFESSEKSASATGKLDALGKFSLTPADPTVGIPPGRYVVLIYPPPAPPVPVSSDNYKQMMMGGGAAKPAVADAEIPLKFQDSQQSPLKLELKDGDNSFDIDLAKF